MLVEAKRIQTSHEPSYAAFVTDSAHSEAVVSSPCTLPSSRTSEEGPFAFFLHTYETCRI